MTDPERKYELKPLEEGDEELIGRKIEEYNYSIAPPAPGASEEDVCLKIADGEGNVIAGCLMGIDAWKTADIDVLWVDERCRRQGLGSMLIREAERMARERGCYLSSLGTFDFQAKPLYEKHGYALCGVIENWPKGHANYTLAKRLDRPFREYIPVNNGGAAKYAVQPGGREDRDAIVKGLTDYNASQARDVCEEQTLSKKITDGDGRLIAGCSAEVDTWADAYVSLWVEEPYRNRGIGSYLLRETEREARERGAYIMLAWAFDWQAEFFKKRGFTVCSAIEDGPKGHRFYGLRKDL